VCFVIKQQFITRVENNMKIKRNISNKPNASILDNFNFRSHGETIAIIKKKIGDKPKSPSDLPKGVWTEQSVRVLEERYLLKDAEGKIIETPDEMCWRVAWDIASADVLWGKKKKDVIRSAEEFYKLMVTHRFLPNSPTLMNAGTRNGLQYSACFVLPIEDSLVGIFDALKYQALIHQTGGGTGFSFSKLRSRGSMVKSSKGTASGPVSFMRVFDAATNEIKQGGKRRGANMGILRIDHPDIMEFIHSKKDGGITNFNISVAITDGFMEAYRNDKEYNLIDPKSKEIKGKLKARDVFDEIAKGAWETGDPGVIFIDRMNDGSGNPVPSLGPIESTNPCGEVPLYPFDSCNLGSIFLTYFVKEKGSTKDVDWDEFRKTIKTATHFMDNVIEMNPYPLEQIRKTSLAIRRIGLGIGGWADLLTDLEIPYDSEIALTLGEKIMRIVKEDAVNESYELARERGPFPMWKESIYRKSRPRRNSTVTTIAPTGSISIIAGSSSGIEPLFAIAYQHIVKDRDLDRTLTFINPRLENMVREKGLWTEDLKNKIAEKGVIREIPEIPESVRNVFGTAHEINYVWHVRHQSTFQKYTENAVSKTINLRNDATVEDVKKTYLLAWETNCKGITIFRDGCKDTQVLNLGINGNKDDKKEEKPVAEEPALERPFVVKGATYRINTPVGTAFVTLNQDEKGNPLELFINVGKAGSDVAAMAEALGRTISIALRFRGNLNSKDRAREIAEQLAGIGGRRSVGYGPNKILSLPDAVSMAISVAMGFRINGYLNHAEKLEESRHLSAEPNGVNGEAVNGIFKNGKSDEAEIPSNITLEVVQGKIIEDQQIPSQLSFGELKVKGDICPTCGIGAMVYQEGCSKCYACGHSEC
jgi:ribonucleoside-diphosphate reductase alpha chain